MRMPRTAVTLAATAALVTGAASPANAYSGMTGEKFEKLTFGMSERQALDIIGPDACERTVWSEGEVSLLCWANQNSDYNPYASLRFTDDQLNRKWQEGLLEPVDPSMTLAKYDQVSEGMTVQQVMDIVDRNSCVVLLEEYPAYPSAAGYELAFHCDAAKGIGYGRFGFVEDELDWKSKGNLE